MTEETTPNRPSHIVWQVTEKEGSDKSYWTRIGAAWAHAGGGGFSLALEAIPLGGRIVMRVPTERDIANGDSGNPPAGDQGDGGQQ